MSLQAHKSSNFGVIFKNTSQYGTFYRVHVLLLLQKHQMMPNRANKRISRLFVILHIKNSSFSNTVLLETKSSPQLHGEPVIYVFKSCRPRFQLQLSAPVPRCRRYDVGGSLPLLGSGAAWGWETEAVTQRGLRVNGYATVTNGLDTCTSSDVT